MMAPKDWRTYERHPISSRYPDIKGQAWEDFLENISKRKIRSRTITLYDGKVLDGWQLYRACIEKDIEPTFTTLGEGEDPEAFVTEKNDMRRHESAEMICQRREHRRHRVAESRQEGKSLRTIAEEENVDEKTVRNDLEASGADPSAPEPKTGQIIGRDGKEYPAPTKEKLYCNACARRLRVGQTLPGRCRECAALRKEEKDANQDADVSESAPKAPPMDELGNELPKNLRDAFAGNRKTIEDVRKLLFEGKRMLKSLEAWNPFVLKNSTIEAIETALDNLKNGLPYSICPACDGKGKACADCRNSGWLPKWAMKEDAR